MENSSQDFQKEGGIFDYPQLKPVKFFLNFDPPQMGMLYKRNPKDKKKHLFLIQLNGLILLGDPEKITQQLYEQYPAFINEKVVNPVQVYGLVSKMLEYIQNMLLQYQENEGLDDEDQNEFEEIKKKRMVTPQLIINYLIMEKDIPEQYLHFHEKRAEFKKNHKQIMKERFKQKRKNKRNKKLENRNKFLEQMTEEEQKEQIQKWKDSNDKDLKNKREQRMKENLNKGLSIGIDLSYHDQMQENEINSLGLQLGFVVGIIRKSSNVMNLTLINYRQEYQKYYGEKFGAEKWIVNKQENDLTTDKKIVYLSPDAEQELDGFYEDEIYIIGGLVDNKIIKNSSKKRAEQMQYEMKSLPLKKSGINLSITRKALNIDKIVRIIDNYLTCKNIEESIRKEFSKKYLTNQQ